MGIRIPHPSEEKRRSIGDISPQRPTSRENLSDIARRLLFSGDAREPDALEGEMSIPLAEESGQKQSKNSISALHRRHPVLGETEIWYNVRYGRETVESEEESRGIRTARRT